MNSFLVRTVALSDQGSFGPSIAPFLLLYSSIRVPCKGESDKRSSRSTRHRGSVFAIERIHFFDLDPGEAFNSASGWRALFVIIITGFPQIASGSGRRSSTYCRQSAPFWLIYSSFETARFRKFF